MARHDRALLDASEPNGWALMEARKQVDEVERSIGIDDHPTAHSAADILYGIWIGAVAYEAPHGPTPVALRALMERAQRVLYGLQHNHDGDSHDG